MSIEKLRMSPGRLKRCDVERAIEEYDELLDYVVEAAIILKWDVKYLRLEDGNRLRIMEQIKKRSGESSAPTA